MVRAKKVFEHEGTLLRKVRTLLDESKQTNLDIYSDTGLQPGWLDTVRRGVIRDPSVNKVQKLYEYLSKSRLTV